MPTLNLKITNVDALPDGGPLSFALAGRRGIDIGRDRHLDWVLPDPSRTVSGKHCHVRYRDGGYWLQDVSSNGTYLNGADSRLAAPVRLRNGDQLEIGPYIVAVIIEDDETSAPPPESGTSGVSSNTADLWAAGPDAASAEPRSMGFQRPSTPRFGTEPLDHVFEVPTPMRAERVSLPHEPIWSAPEDVSPGPGTRPASVTTPAHPPETPREPVRTAADPTTTSEPPPSHQSSADVVIRAFARGAGLAPEALSGRSPEALAEDIGRIMRLTVTELQHLMRARAETKSAMRSSRHTTVQALDNNPIAFVPSPADALRVMLADQSSGYLRGEQAITETFETLKAHQLGTYVALQDALDALIRQIAPEVIEEDVSARGGLMLSSRKARAWETFVARWDALSRTHPDGIRGAVLALLGASYDRVGRKEPNAPH